MATVNFIRRTVLISAVMLTVMVSWDVKAEPQSQAAHYQNARLALAKSDTDQAGRELRLVLQADPLDPKAHYLLASLLASQGEEDQAIIGFQRVVSIDPTHPEALHNLGTLLLRRGEAVPAAQLLETAVKDNPDYIPPYNSLAKAYYIAGLPELAMATYREAVHRDATNQVAKQNLALLLAAAEVIPPKADGPRENDNPSEGGLKLPPPPAKDKKSPPDAKLPASEKVVPKPPTVNQAGSLRRFLKGLPHVLVEEYDNTIALTGWTRGRYERGVLDRVLTKWPNVIDLTGGDAGDPQRMLEVDVVLFVVTGQSSQSVGFNFLRHISLSATYFSSNNSDNLTGLRAPGIVGSALKIPAWGSFFTAAVDYDVNIANAIDDKVAVLARPHLTTLNGTPASFLSGGEFVFKVSGIESGDIKPYPFGTSLTVTPTLLRTPGEDGNPRVHLNIKAQRTSILEFLTAETDDDSIVFDKLNVTSQAVLGIDQTLILSGLNQREARTSNSGVPLLKDIPLLKYVFSQETTVESNTAVIILLTPRDPAFIDDSRRKALREFIKMRRAFSKAEKGSIFEMRQFQKRYPKWKALPPNRFSSHFFLVENSDIYRRVSGEDLTDEDLDLHLLDGPEKEKRDNTQDNEQDK